MNEMPKSIKRKLIQYAKANYKAKKKHDELVKIFEKHKVPYENLVFTEKDYSSEESITEALAFINKCELDDIQNTIEEIEKVFLYFVNK
jgi:hypothetical protein